MMTVCQLVLHGDTTLMDMTVDVKSDIFTQGTLDLVKIAMCLCID